MNRNPVSRMAERGDAWSDCDGEDCLWFSYVIYWNCDQIKGIE